MFALWSSTAFYLLHTYCILKSNCRETHYTIYTSKILVPLLLPTHLASEHSACSSGHFRDLWNLDEKEDTGRRNGSFLNSHLNVTYCKTRGDLECGARPFLQHLHLDLFCGGHRLHCYRRPLLSRMHWRHPDITGANRHGMFLGVMIEMTPVSIHTP